MNPVTFNDKFTHLKQHMTQNGRAEFEMALTGPLLLHDCGKETWHTDDFLHCFDSHFMPLLPFNSFRAEIKNTSLDGFEFTFNYIVREIKAASGDRVILMWVSPSKLTTIGISKFDNALHELKYITFIFSWAANRAPTKQFPGPTILTCTGFHRSLGEIGKDAECKQVMFTWAREFLSKMCIDYLNPHMALARVSPKGAGRSTQWIEQRTYCTLVHKSHPANNNGIPIGAIIRSANASEIHRMAHSRRAHFRLLRSPKFKNKVGQRIFIKSAWIGPKEWEDSTGHVYKLIETQKDHFAA